MTPEDKNFRVNARWAVTTDEGSETFDLEDLGCETVEQWLELTEDEREVRIQEAIDHLPQDRVFLLLDTYDEM